MNTPARHRPRVIAEIRARRAMAHKPRRRRIPKQAQPLPIEREYARAIQVYVREASAVVNREIAPMVPVWAAEQAAEVARSDALREDGLGQRIAAYINRIAGRFLASIRPVALDELADKFARRTSTWNKVQIDRQVKAAVGVDVFAAEPNLAPIVDTFVAENVALIRNVPQQFMTNVEGIVLRGVTSGTLPRDIAEQLADEEGVAMRRAKNIARDQVGKLYGRLNAVRQQRLGVKTYTWATVSDNRVRPEHEERDGKVYAWNPEDATDEIEYLPPEEQPGQPIACFPGETPVRSPSPVSVAYRRWFDGELTVIVTDTGEALRATPNHPIRTAEGWVAAHLLDVGDHVLKAPDQRGELAVRDPERADPTIEEVHRAACALGVAHRVRGAASGFHGDGSDQEVDVVDVDWSLGLEVDPSLSQRVCQKALARTDEAGLRAGAPYLALLGVSSAAHRSVGGIGELLAILGAGVSHANDHRFAAVARLDAIADELQADGRARDAEVLRDLLHAPPVGVELRDHVARVLAGIARRAVLAGDHEALFPQASADVVRGPSDRLGSLGEGGAGQHEFARVVEKFRVRWAGHVFNLGTEFGWYVARNVTVHNCRCFGDANVDELLEGL